jgi:hypothetical protein
MKMVATWELPSDIFTKEGTFVNLDGEELCLKNGCIFRINEL